MVCILHLAYVFSGIDTRDDFSMVVQGSGGTGKTKSIIVAVKEFVQVVTNTTGVGRWDEYLLLVRPTNVVALAMRKNN